MQMNKNWLILIIPAILVSGCVDPFTPKIDEYQNLIVINGRITDQEGYQYVEVSRSSPFNNPQDNPVNNCTVTFYDSESAVYNLQETSPGKYQVWMEKDNLVPGNKYKMKVLTPDGKTYASDFVTLLPCPPVDSVYYEETVMNTDDPDQTFKGIQFYADADATGLATTSFMWELTETWEYHSRFMLDGYYNGRAILHVDPGISDSLYYCWKTSNISNYYTYSTLNLTANKIKKMPLNFVSNEENRLSVRYSLLVKQYSLTTEAFNYWDELRKQSQESGKLYETQPSRIKGNIACIDDPHETVLGYFTVTSVKEKRIFAPALINAVYDCNPTEGLNQTEMIFRLSSLSVNNFPYYLYYLQHPDGLDWFIVKQSCFDCTLKGGILQKPDFW